MDYRPPFLANDNILSFYVKIATVKVDKRLSKVGCAKERINNSNACYRPPMKNQMIRNFIKIKTLQYFWL